jgi:hypothetical protein
LIESKEEIKKKKNKFDQKVAKRKKLLTFALPKRKRVSKIGRVFERG